MRLAGQHQDNKDSRDPRDRHHKDRDGFKERDGGNRSSEYKEFVVKVSRTAKVVKGGRRFSFSALVVVGNGAGKIGIGFGKANEVPHAVAKATQQAHKRMVTIAKQGETIAHEVIGRCGASRLWMKPASPGTGVIAGAAVRAVFEAAGVKDILTKAHGSTNAVNLVKATLSGLQFLRTREQEMALRGVEIKATKEVKPQTLKN